MDTKNNPADCTPACQEEFKCRYSWQHSPPHTIALSPGLWLKRHGTAFPSETTAARARNLPTANSSWCEEITLTY